MANDLSRFWEECQAEWNSVWIPFRRQLILHMMLAAENERRAALIPPVISVDSGTPRPVSPLPAPPVIRRNYKVPKRGRGAGKGEAPIRSPESLVPVDPKPNEETTSNDDIRFELGISLRIGASSEAKKKKKNHRHSCAAKNTPVSSHDALVVKRQLAEDCYYRGDDRSAVQLWTQVLAAAEEHPPAVEWKTVVIAHRAAALYRLGAYAAALAEYQRILPHDLEEAPDSTDAAAKEALYQRLLFLLHATQGLAWAALKLGQHEVAQKAWFLTLRVADESSLLLHRKTVPLEKLLHHLKTVVAPVRQEASLGLVLTEHVHSYFASRSWKYDEDATLVAPPCPWTLRRRLDAVRLALSIAPGATELWERKLTLLAQLRQWRQVIGVCERWAAWNVRFDHVFVGDLAAYHPFPNLPPALHLTLDRFGTLLEEDDTTRTWQIETPDAAAEAVLRLPRAAQRYYLRALRLEDRCSLAEAALRALERWMMKQPEHSSSSSDEEWRQQMAWLSMERSKLKRTQDLRKRADRLYDLEDFPEAAILYKQCRGVDAEGLPSPRDGDGLETGGRMHLTLNFCLAQCYMELKRWKEANDIWNSVLKHYPSCMKSLLHRGRCYVQLNRISDAVTDYEQWLELAQKSRHLEDVPSTAFVLGGPYKSKGNSIALIRKECEAARKKSETINAVAMGGFALIAEPKVPADIAKKMMNSDGKEQLLMEAGLTELVQAAIPKSPANSLVECESHLVSPDAVAAVEENLVTLGHLEGESSVNHQFPSTRLLDEEKSLVDNVCVQTNKFENKQTSSGSFPDTDRSTVVSPDIVTKDLDVSRTEKSNKDTSSIDPLLSTTDPTNLSQWFEAIRVEDEENNDPFLELVSYDSTSE